MARLLYPQAEDLTILKPRHSAFFASPLELLLKEMQTRELVICGLATDMCVQLTAMDAFLREYRPGCRPTAPPASRRQAKTASLEYMAVSSMRHPPRPRAPRGGPPPGPDRAPVGGTACTGSCSAAAIRAAARHRAHRHADVLLLVLRERPKMSGGYESPTLHLVGHRVELAAGQPARARPEARPWCEWQAEGTAPNDPRNHGQARSRLSLDQVKAPHGSEARSGLSTAREHPSAGQRQSRSADAGRVLQAHALALPWLEETSRADGHEP